MDPIEISAIAMKNDLSRLDSISNNVANLTTPGYKKLVSFTETLAAQSKQIQREFAGDSVIGASTLALPVVKTISDQSAAALKQSDNPLDLAIEGDAYFELQTTAGTVYSRRGNFSLDNSGRLYLSGTEAYLNGVGGDIRVSSEPTIDVLGRVFEGQQQIGQLKLMTFANADQLQSVGKGLFVANNLAGAEVFEKPVVRQGFLEASNTQPSDEMVELVQLSRRLEATQQVIRGYDGMLETALDDLGNF